MNIDLKKSALVAEIVGGVGIIVSILYLAFEVSQNTANTKAANSLAILSEENALREMLIENPEFVEVLRIGNEDLASLSATDSERFVSYFASYLTLWETAALMEREDLLPEGVWGGINNGYCLYLNRDGFRIVWQEIAQDLLSPEFSSVVDACYNP